MRYTQTKEASHLISTMKRIQQKVKAKAKYEIGITAVRVYEE